MTIRMTPFQALYGYDASTFADQIFGYTRAPKSKEWIQEGQDILKILREDIQATQNQQKVYADRHRVEHSFEVGDFVYLCLHPYRQSSFKKKGAKKFQPRFCGPYKIIRKVGEVAYELELPPESKIHNVFHVSHLKKVVGQQIVTSSELPPIDDEGQLVLIPEHILEVWEWKLRNIIIRDYLVQWKDLLIEEATWEAEQVLQHPTLQLLEDKQIERGGL